MVARGLTPPSLSVAGGSALTKSCRPVASETLAIWAPAGVVKRVEQRTSVPRRSPAAVAVRFAMVPLRKNNNLEPDTTSFRHACRQVNVSSVLGTPAKRSTRRRTAGERFTAEQLLALLRPRTAARSPIIAKARGGRGYSIGHFLGKQRLCRQPRPGPAGHPRSRPPAWPAPVSACQHGL